MTEVVATSSGTAPRPRLLPRGMAARELAVVLARPRALAIRLGMPLALAVVLLAGHAPTFWAAMLLTVMVAMVGAVGTAVTVSRARDAGLLTRLSATPRSRPRLVGEWVLAAAGVDLLQLLPVALAASITGGDAASLAILVVVLAATLVVTNTLGCLVTLLAASAAEVLLDVVVVLAPLLYLGGLFTGVPAQGWRSAIAAVDPFSHLHSAFIRALGGASDYAATVDALAAAAAAATALLVLGVMAARVLERE